MTEAAVLPHLALAPIDSPFDEAVIEIGGATVRVREGTDSQQLRMVLQALRA